MKTDILKTLRAVYVEEMANSLLTKDLKENIEIFKKQNVCA